MTSFFMTDLDNQLGFLISHRALSNSPKDPTVLYFDILLLITDLFVEVENSSVKMLIVDSLVSSASGLTFDFFRKHGGTNNENYQFYSA